MVSHVIDTFLMTFTGGISSLKVHVKRSVKGKDSSFSNENGNMTPMSKILKPSIIRRSKLVIVDLAGSERIDKSGIAFIFSFPVLAPIQ